MNNLTARKKLAFWLSFGILVALSIAAQVPGYVANEDYKYELGKREISNVTRPEQTTLRHIVSMALDTEYDWIDLRWGGRIEKWSPKQPINLFYIDDQLVWLKDVVEKAGLESRADESFPILFDKEAEGWVTQLEELRKNFHFMYSQWYTKKKLVAAKLEYNSVQRYDSNTFWKAAQEKQITRLRIGGVAFYFFAWMVFLFQVARFVKGFTWKQVGHECRRIPLLAIVGPFAAVGFLFARPKAKLILWAKVATAATKAFGTIVAARAKALAYGLATMLACAVSIGAANAQATGSAQKSKGKTNSAWITGGLSDNRTLAEQLEDELALVLAKETRSRFMIGLAVTSQTPFPAAANAPTWKFTLDSKTAEEQGGTLTQTVRLTSLRHNGFLIEDVVNVSQGPVLRTVANDLLVGNDIHKTDTVTINVVVGGKFSITNNSKTQATVTKTWALTGLQLFVSTKHWVLNLPVFRAEIPIASEGTRLGFASNHEFRYKFGSHFQAGEETFFGKAIGQAAVRIHGLTARVKPSTKWPWLEVAVFKNYFNGHLSARGRATINF